MKNLSRLFVVVFGLMLFVASCKKPVPDLALLIPKDASSVIEFDPKTLSDKIASSGIGIDSLANIVFQKNNTSALHWNDIKNSGISLTKPMFVFNKANNSMQSGNTNSLCVIAAIDDKEKLIAFFKKQKPGGDFLSDAKYQYVALGNGFVAGWNDKALVISMAEGNTSGNYNNGQGTLSQQLLTTVFSQQESASVASIGEFRDLMGKQGDIHFWSNPASTLNAIPMLGVTKLSTLLQETYTEGTIDFENGKAVATIETHVNKTLSDMLNKYGSREIDKTMFSNYPQPVDGFGIIAFNPKVLIDILKYLGFDGMADGYISQMGFTTNDVMNAFSGDIAFMVSNMFEKHNDIPGASPMNTKNGSFILNMRVGDKAAFAKVMSGLVSKGILSRKGNQYSLGMHGGHDFVIEIMDNNLLIASSEALINSYQTNNNKTNLPADIDKQLSNKSMAMYVDVNGLLKNINTNDSTGTAVLQTAQTTFKDFIYTADKTSGKTFTGNATINLLNTNENSLAGFVKFISVVHERSLMHKDEHKFNPNEMDSLQTPETSPNNDSD